MVIFGFHEGLNVDLEGRVLTARYTDCSIIMVYAPAKPEANTCFLKTLLAHVTIEMQQHLPIILMGDLNVPRDPEDIATPQSWMAQPIDYTIQQELLESIILKLRAGDPGRSKHDFTWFPQPNKSMQSKWIGMRIDYILHSTSLTCTEFRTLLSLGGSDHRPTQGTFSLPTGLPPLPPCIATAPLTHLLPQTSLPIEEETRLLQQFGSMVLRSQLNLTPCHEPPLGEPHFNNCVIQPSV
jgi:exonuclease III